MIICNFQMRDCEVKDLPTAAQLLSGGATALTKVVELATQLRESMAFTCCARCIS